MRILRGPIYSELNYTKSKTPVQSFRIAYPHWEKMPSLQRQRAGNPFINIKLETSMKENLMYQEARQLEPQSFLIQAVGAVLALTPDGFIVSTQDVSYTPLTLP